MLGFLLHKGLTAGYSYLWWEAEATPQCRAARELNQVFECINKEIGFVSKIAPYVLAAPNYTFRKWELRY